MQSLRLFSSGASPASVLSRTLSRVARSTYQPASSRSSLHCRHYSSESKDSSELASLREQLVAPSADGCVMALTEEQLHSFHENGFLHVKEFVPKRVALLIRERVMHLLDTFDASETSSIFDTHKTEEYVRDDSYFLESGDKVRYFWEPDAFELRDGESMDDAWLRVRANKQQYINKIGHALHTEDDLINGYIWGFGIPQMCYQLGMQQPVALQSMYICKQAGVGGEVGTHQDSPFLWTDPHSCHGFWLSVDSASKSNGCLWAVPGSHKSVGVRNRLQRLVDDKTGEILAQTKFSPLEADGSYNTDGGVCVETEVGDLVIIHGSVVHWSEANRSEDVRHALMLHCVDGACDYPATNWLQYAGGTSTFPRFTREDLYPENQMKKRLQLFT